MRKFAFSFAALFAGMCAVQSFAQPRDLFAEFEAEAEAADASSSSVAPSSSSVVPASSVAVSSSSEVPQSSSVEPSSSSIASSSSVAESAPADTVTAAQSQAPIPQFSQIHPQRIPLSPIPRSRFRPRIRTSHR